MPAVSEITPLVAEVKRANNAAKKARNERDEINEIAKKQRVEIRRLKVLLKSAYDLIPSDVRADKLIQDIDTALFKAEL